MHPEDITQREKGADRDARDVAHARWIRASRDRQISQVAALFCVPLVCVTPPASIFCYILKKIQMETYAKPARFNCNFRYEDHCNHNYN